MSTYLCFYKSDKIIVQAETSYEAQRKAQAIWKLSDRQRQLISVYLQCFTGNPYEHSSSTV